jgi:S-formylglutathione hydrolase FrmB
MLLAFASCHHPRATDEAAAKPSPAAPPASQPAAPPASQLAAPSGTVIDGTFHSDALGVDKHWVAWLPPGYDAPENQTRRYPVVYWLHGLSGNEWNAVNWHIDQAAADAKLDAILFFLDGDDSFYANWVRPAGYDECLKHPRPFGAEKDMTHYCVKSGRYEDYVAKDAVAFADGKFRTIADRTGRAIAGISMGGLGALELAFRNKSLYAAVASHSGVDSLLYKGPHPYDASKATFFTAADIGQFGSAIPGINAWVTGIYGDFAGFQAHDPATLAAKLNPGELAIYLDCGTDDDLGLDANAAYLHDVLTARKIAHTYFEGPGGHNQVFWQGRFPESLKFFAGALHSTK